MNEKQPSAIEKITLSEATYHGCDVMPTFINFFFGNNGVGKTTIARLIKSCRKSPNAPSDPSAENPNVAFSQGRTSADYNILVYNQDFIDANIQRYNELPGVFTMNEHNITTQNEIAEDKKKKKEIDDSIAALKEKVTANNAAVQTAENDFKNNCWNNSKNIREAFPFTQEGFRKDKKKFANKIFEQDAAERHSIEELQNLYNTAFDPNARTYPLLYVPKNCDAFDTIPGIELLNTPINSTADTDFGRFIKAVNSADWVRQGHLAFGDTPEHKCPYCQQTLPNDFEEKIAACFNEQYRTDVRKLELFQQSYKDTANTIFLALQNNSKSEYDKLDFSVYNDKLTVLRAAITANLQTISEKMEKPGKVVALEAIAPILRELCSIIDAMNTLIIENNKVVSSKQKSQENCSKKVWELLAYTLQNDVFKFRQSLKEIKSSTQNLKTNIQMMTADSEVLRQSIDKKSGTIINTSDTVKGMNKLLRDSGFQGFSIEEDKNTPNVYKVVRPGGIPADRLSEGERNFIAFLYFYHLVHGNGSIDEAQSIYDDNGNQTVISDGSDNRDKIVVIDDPVSSMDSSSLFIVASLVREMTAICSNNVSMHKTGCNGDYIKQIFILTHNAHFHRAVTVNQERHYRYVSFFHITKNNNISNIKLCVQKNHDCPTNMENYNPVQNAYAALWTEYKEVTTAIPLLNVIRKILEYYFIQICGYNGVTIQERILSDANRRKFVSIADDGTEDTTQLQIVSSMLSYISSNSFGLNDGLYFVDDCTDVELYRELFESIFKCMNQEQHFNMMMGIDD